MRARFGALLALFLACSPIASAQIANPQIAPQQTPYHSIVGSFTLSGVSYGTLTLTRNANNVVRGTYVSPIYAINATCRGDANGPGFLITCTQASQPHIVISAAALPVTLTTTNAPPQPHIRGFLYMVSLSANQASSQMSVVPFFGHRE